MMISPFWFSTEPLNALLALNWQYNQSNSSFQNVLGVYTNCCTLTCLTSLWMADITINPLQTTGEFSSTRNPIDILRKQDSKSYIRSGQTNYTQSFPHLFPYTHTCTYMYYNFIYYHLILLSFLCKIDINYYCIGTLVFTLFCKVHS